MTVLSDCRLTADDLDKLASAARSFIESSCNGDEDSVTPQLLIQVMDPRTKERSLEVLAFYVPFNEHEDKHNALFRAGQRYWEQQKLPLAWCLISEAWISTQVGDGPRKYAMPADDPNRVEAVIYHLLTFVGEARHGYLPVDRSTGHMKRSADWVETTIDAKLSSPLCLSFARGFMAEVARKHGLV